MAAIYNPNKIDGPRLRRAVTKRALKHGWTDPLLLETTEADPGAGMARTAVEADAGLVVVVGGDGTVRNVASGLADSSTPLGIIPTGTGNLLARNLGLPLDDMDDALRIAMGGHTRSIDLGRVTYTDADDVEHDEVYLVMLGVGMDADLIAGADDELKARLGWVAYISSFTSALFRGHRIQVVYSVDSDRFRFARTRSLLVGNCGVLQGGMVLFPDAELDDGLLDVLTLRPKGLIGWVRASYRVLVANKIMRSRSGDPLRRANAEKLLGDFGERVLDFRQGRRVEVHPLGEPAPFQIDGDSIGAVTKFVASVSTRRVGIRVPH